MPRQARPRWDEKKRRWYGNIGHFDRAGRRREVYAPPEIGRRDEAAAWGWFAGERRARGLDEPPRPTRPPKPPKVKRPARPWLFGRGERLEALAIRAADAAEALRSRKLGAGVGRRVAVLDRRAARLRALALAERIGGAA